MRTTTLTRAAAAGCVLIVLATGCSKASGGDAKPTGDATDTATMGPLSAYFDKISGSQDEQGWNDLAKKSEDVVAACMREQGFEYTPSQSVAVASNESINGPQNGTEECAAQNGYGITTQMGPDASNAQRAAAAEWVDPNADYLATMSQTEQDAFEAALYGKPVEVSTDDLSETAGSVSMEYDWVTGGCQGKSQHEVYDQGAGAAYSDPTFVSLQDEMNKVWESARTDPKAAEIDAAWSSCMADAGYDFPTPSDATGSIADKLRKLYPDGVDPGMPQAVTATTAPAVELDPAALAGLRAEEIKTAVADATCKKSVDYDNVLQRIQFAAEQAFVDAHKTELDAWVATYAEASK